MKAKKLLSMKRRKNTTLIIFCTLILIFLVIGVVNSCKKEEVFCNCNEPFTDFPWLQDFINQAKKGDSNVSIFICSYKNGIAFMLVTDCPRYCWAGPGYVILSYDGDLLCYGNLPNTIPCQEFEVDFKNKILLCEIIIHK